MTRLDKPDTSPKGIVDPAGAAKRIRLARYLPCEALRPFVEHYWLVAWDLADGPPQTQRTLPYPNAHLVFEAGRSAVYGVVRGPFDRELAGAGHVLGVRFFAGGLRPFIDTPMSRITDRTLPLDAVLRAPDAETRVLSARDDETMVAQAEAMLLEVLPELQPRAGMARRAIEIAAAAQGPTTVAALCAAMDTGERALQRLFSEYVGVSPKWVVQRFRLQEAMWRLSQPGQHNLAELAQELGFFDQAHLTRDFTRLVGMPPHEYWKSQQ